MSKNIDRILQLFVEDSYRKFNVREAARMANVSPSTASKYLEDATKKGLLKKEKSRNLILFSADMENQKFRDVKIYRNIEKIRSSGLIDFLEKEMNYPEAIILFGSYAKGENNRKSDIDLFVLSELKKESDMAVYEKKLGTKIQLFISNKEETERMKKTGKEILNNIINGIRLSGFFEVFG